jgi:cytochrome c556
MLAESANLLMMPGRAKDQDGWMKDAQRLLDAGTAAFEAAKAKDVDKLAGLNDQMYAACVACHNDYRPNYRKRPLTPQ